MNLFVPSLGTRVKLTKDWKFTLYGEHRNETLIAALGNPVPVIFVSQYSHETPQSKVVTLPRGTVLRLDRIYVRRGKDDYDSLTWVVEELRGEKVKRTRFWATLEDCNKMSVVVIDG